VPELDNGIHDNFAPEAAPPLGDTSNLLPSYRSLSAAKRALGSPGAGNVFDHTVEQSQIARSGFTPEEINSPYNLNPIPASLNQARPTISQASARSPVGLESGSGWAGRASPTSMSSAWTS
jgi:hypothetical protein